jgi:hypothetical protein
MGNGEGDEPSPILIPGPMGALALRSSRINHREAPRTTKTLRATTRSRLVTPRFSNRRREIFYRLVCMAQMQPTALTGGPTRRDSCQQLLATFPFMAIKGHVWDNCLGATLGPPGN